MSRFKELNKKYISGIQQIGVGVSDFHEAWKWYIPAFGMNIRMFEERAMAEYMLPHTDGKPWERHACLAMNMQGGGGFEIWQHTQREPLAPTFKVQVGDLGIYAGKIKSPDIKAAYGHLSSEAILQAEDGRKAEVLTGISKDPAGRSNFFLRDPFGNVWQVVEEGSMFMTKYRKPTGGSYGAVIGSSDIDRVMDIYQGILDYDKVVYDETGRFDDLNGVPGGEGKFRRVLLKHSKARKGPFSRLFGPTELELVQALERKPQKIFKDRIWGDQGFIHLCFDILGMKALKEECAAKGYPFTVDSDVHPSGKPFDMGEAAGHFSYIEDPDGTLIEFVETHKIPVSKKLGWYLDLWKRRDVTAPLGDGLLKMIRFMKVNPARL